MRLLHPAQCLSAAPPFTEAPVWEGQAAEEALDTRASAASDVSESTKAGAEAARRAQQEAWDAQARKKAVR